MGIIGGADGPTAVLVGGVVPEQQTVCSSVTFQPQERVEWQPIFRGEAPPPIVLAGNLSEREHPAKIEGGE